MPATSTSTVVLGVVAALALLLLPGWVVLLLARVRGFVALALAPACSVALIAVAAIVAVPLGWTWGLPAVGVIVTGAMGLARLLAGTRGARPLDRHSRWLWLGVGGGLVAAVAPSLMVSLPPGYLQRWDTLFHMAALRMIETTGSASSLQIGSLSYGDGRDSFYPAGFHAFASLLSGEVPVQLVIGATVVASVPWVLGCAALAREFARLPDARADGEGSGRRLTLVGAVAAVLAGLVTPTPMSLWIGWGHIPNAAGLAMLPGVLAFGLAMLRARSVVGVVALLTGLLGLGLAQPNAAIAGIVLLLPVLATAVWRHTREDLRDGRRFRGIAVPVAAVLGVVAIALVLQRSPLTASVTGYQGGADPVAASTALGQLVRGHWGLWPSDTGIAIAVGAVVGAVVLAFSRSYLGAGMVLIAAVLYIDAAIGAPAGLSALWYSSTARLAVVLAAVAVPLTAAALSRLPHRVAVRNVAVAVTAVVLLGIGASTIPDKASRSADLFDTRPGNPPQLLTAPEIDMLARISENDGAILGSPFSGAAAAYGLHGADVVFPVAGQVLSPDQQLILEHVDELGQPGAEPEVCAALERLGVRYLYQDTEPYQQSALYDELDRVQLPGVVPVATGGTAQVLPLPPCAG